MAAQRMVGVLGDNKGPKQHLSFWPLVLLFRVFMYLYLLINKIFVVHKKKTSSRARFAVIP